MRFVKLIEDVHRALWICGDAEGGLLLASFEYLRNFVPPMDLWAVRVKNLSGLAKQEVDGYTIHAGFDEDNQTWYYVDAFEKAQEDSIEDVAGRLEF